MSSNYILPLSESTATIENVGGKGASLQRLSAAGLPVPDGFFVTTAAYRQFVRENGLQAVIEQVLQNLDPALPAALETASERIRDGFLGALIPEEIGGAVIQAYAALSGQNPAVAVRSSATAEDLPEASFAGQQETYLNVSHPENVLEAVQRCWASLWTARAIGYRAHQKIDPDQVALAVVVQRLVPAEAAGILFTANPINGRHDQLVINASWGLGEAVVGGAVTPDTLIVEKETGKVLERQTADKQVMTARVNGGTQEQPVPESLRRLTVLDDRAAAHLNHMGVQIEKLYGQPMDIEWTLCDGEFSIVQARPITMLPEAVSAGAPETTSLIEWKLPDPKGHYMRASITELTPDPLSPLFATLGMASIEKGICEMGKDVFKVPPDFFSGFMLTINGYAYQNVNFSARQWLLILAKMLPRMPSLFSEGIEYWQNSAHPRYARVAQRWQNQPIQNMTSVEIWNGVHDIMAAFGHHLGALMASTMGPSAGSEGLFTQVYEKLIRKDGDPEAMVFLLGFDSIPIQSEKALYDLSRWVHEREELAAFIRKAPAEEIARTIYGELLPEGVPLEDWEAFETKFGKYLDNYGYLIYDMDFAKPLPRDDPEPFLETLKLFLAHSGKNPYERQQAYVHRREQAEAAVLSRVGSLKRWAFNKTINWAQSLAPFREDGIAEIGLGYPVVRRMLLELGRRLVEFGAIQYPEDIFWLEESEVEAAVNSLENEKPVENFAAAIEDRKALWKARKQRIPPPQLPVGKKYLGVNMESLMPASEESQAGSTIKGAATSPGQMRGKACVLHGPEDFDQMQPGDILVASITTPAWTPLFAMASAVVTDIGGPLSHSSIVAREYGIPAVLGTGVATRRIHSGQVITVDGTRGIVILEDEEKG